ncbi:MAG: TonB-dependent receptor [Acidobacteriota bacterium]
MRQIIFRLTNLLGCVALIVLFSIIGNAQFRAGVQGVVTDNVGGIVPGVTVTLTNTETNQSQTTTTSDEGYYRFSNLPPGIYTITAEKADFKKVVNENVKVDAETIRGVDLVLEAGVISETVTIQAENTGIETEDANIRKVITNDEILNLPQVGRDPYELARLTPGVFGAGARSADGGSAALPNTTGPGGSNVGIFGTENQVPIVANGQRLSSNNFQVDGTSVNSQTWGGAAVITPSQEAVKEVQVTSSTYNAEDGRNSGASVRVVTQNGTNDYHGSLFFKYNDPGWNAYNRYFGVLGNDPFAPRRVNNRNKTFGGSFGGPLPFLNFGEGVPPFISGKDKLFFFFSYEGARTNSSTPYEAWIETPQYRQLVRSLRPGGVTARVFGSPGIEPRILALLPRTCAFSNIPGAFCQAAGSGLDIGSPVLGLNQYVPLNDPFYTGGGLDGIPDIQYALLDNVNQFQGDQYFGRVDFNATSSDVLTFSMFYTPATSFTSDNAGRSRPMSDIRSERLNWSTAFVYNRIFTPSLLNQFRVNFTKWGFDEGASNPNTDFGIPRIEVEGLPFDRIRFGANRSENTPGNLSELQMDIRDIATVTRGNHSLKIGAEFRRDKNDNSIQGGARPLYSFVRLWNLANDTPIFESINASPVTGAPAEGSFQYRSNNYALFAQDDWKFRPNLTLNLGLRWEYFGPLKDKSGNLNNLILGSNGLQNATVQPVDQLHDSDWNNFGPQVGFAYSPNLGDKIPFWPKKEFVLRGGLGIGYNRLPNTVFLNARGNPPNLARYNICCGTAAGEFGSPYAGGQILYATGTGLLGYPANPVLGGGINPATGLPLVGKVEFYGSPQKQDNGEVYRFSLEGQQELPFKLLATLGYQGSTSRHLVRIIRLENVLPVGNDHLFATYFPTPDVNSNYHAMNARLQRRFANGFQFDAIYRWSKSLDQLSYEGPGGVTNQTYPLNNDTEWGPSDFDVRHNFTVSGIWDLPFFRKQNNLAGKLLGGWQVSGIWTMHTGFPWTPKVDVQLRTAAGEFYGPVRPIAYIGPAPDGNSNANFLRPGGLFPNAGPAVQIPGTCLYRNNYFILSVLPVRNTPATCQSGAYPGDPSNVLNFPGIGRNVFRGPKYSSADMTLSKRFGIPGLGENSGLDIRFNFFNVFNNLNLTGFGFFDNGTFVARGDRFNPVSNQQFGEPSGALAGRTVEFQARFSF